MPDLVVSADLVLLDSERFIEDGAVRIRGGRIAAVGRRAEILSRAVDELRLRRAILCPGLVNAHTHLALSGLAGAAPRAPGFAAWVRAVAPRIRALAPPALARSLARGSSLSIRSGTTAVGDIVPASVFAQARRGPLAGVRFLEILGFDARFADLRLPRLRRGEGLAPHAPYSTSADLYRGAVALARRRGVRLALHVAESEEEERFVRRGTGPFRDILAALGRLPADWAPPGRSSLRYLASLGALDVPALAVHATLVSRRDLPLLARPRVSVVTCPRSNLALSGRTADVPALLRAGAAVALGTDSLASSSSLSMLDEMRALRAAHPSLSAETALDIATRAGARALGLEAGKIAPGLRADLAAFRVKVGDASPAEALVASRQACFVAVGGAVLRA